MWVGRTFSLTASAPWLKSSMSAVPKRGSTSSGMTATAQPVPKEQLQDVAELADLSTGCTQASSMAQAPRFRRCHAAWHNADNLFISDKFKQILQNKLETSSHC